MADSPLEQQLRHALKAAGHGKATPEQVAEVADAVTTMVVADQSRAFIDVVTDGMVRWDGPLSHLARHLDGLETGELVRWFDTNFYDRRVHVVGEIRRPKSFLTADYAVADDIAQKPLKPVLPGPVTFSRMARDEHYGSRERVAHAVAEALAAEVADLAAAGATCFQLDEPLLCRYPEDLELVAQTAERVFAAAGEGATTVLSTYYGDLAALADRLERIPGTHLGMDMVSGPANFELLKRLPEDRGVVLGLFDARTTLQEDAADVAARLEPHRRQLVQRDVLVGPNAGLELLPRDHAFDKLLHARYLVEKLTAEWTWPS